MNGTTAAWRRERVVDPEKSATSVRGLLWLGKVINVVSAKSEIDAIKVCPQTCEPSSSLSNAHFLQDQSPDSIVAMTTARHIVSTSLARCYFFISSIKHRNLVLLAGSQPLLKNSSSNIQPRPPASLFLQPSATTGHLFLLSRRA